MLNIRLLTRCWNAAGIPRKSRGALYLCDNVHKYEEQPYTATRHFSSDRSTSASSASGEKSSKNYDLSRIGAAGVLLGMGLYWKLKKDVVTAAKIDIGEHRKDLPTYTTEDVAQHKTKDAQIWMTYKCGVYDVTDYVSKHPGGPKILLAVGRNLEPYFEWYPVHKKAEVLGIIEKFRIGNIIPSEKTDQKPPRIPEIDLKSYKLEIAVDGKNKLKLNVDELKKNFPKMSTQADVHCSTTKNKISTVGPNVTATWTGVSLNEVLKAAGIDVDKCSYKQVVFEGMDKKQDGSPYISVVLMELARKHKNNIVIAYEKNGSDLPREQGYPARAIIPRDAGGRHIKWLNKIYINNG
ncbi:sulfite oxidase [Patella vulgata]|uniref:sulfite oxidase n=1 Tax=Patella vulgata TaxID=6465 RepID=UPI0024A9D6F9|nr:sulfite oxidase [Patella vulgata]